MSPKNSCLVKKKKKEKQNNYHSQRNQIRKEKIKGNIQEKGKRKKKKKKEKVIGQSGYGHFYPLNSPIFFFEFFLYFGKKTF